MARGGLGRAVASPVEPVRDDVPRGPPPGPRYPLFLIAALVLAFFAAAEYVDGWYGWRRAPDALLRGYLEHAWHISLSLAGVVALLVARWWMIRTRAA